MEMVDRVERLRAMVDDGRIVRGEWVDGHDRACLLAALSPEVALAKRASACPASVMPAWLAETTPSIDDLTSAAAWPAIVRRYADLAGRWSALSPDAWERVRVVSLLAIVREARSRCPPRETLALSAIDEVIGWLEQGAPEEERGRVHAAAEAAVWAAEATGATVAAEVLRAASRAAETWATSLAEAASAAALAAATPGAWEQSKAEAWDRIARAVMDAIEAECLRAEGKHD